MTSWSTSSTPKSNPHGRLLDNSLSLWQPTWGLQNLIFVKLKFCLLSTIDLDFYAMASIACYHYFGLFSIGLHIY